MFSLPWYVAQYEGFFAFEGAKIIGLRSSVTNQTLLVKGDSPHYYPGSLGYEPIAVQFHAGSHCTALRLLEGYLPAEKIKLLHFGSPENRLEALLISCLLYTSDAADE